MVTLGEAARQLGVSKPTLSKAIAKGALSATRRDDGSFAIDPSELVRWWENVRHRFQAQPVPDLQLATHSDKTETPETETVHGRQPATPEKLDAEVAARLAALETEVRGLRELLSEVKASRDTVQTTADQWRTQAERLTLMLPAPDTTKGASHRLPAWQWVKRLVG